MGANFPGGVDRRSKAREKLDALVSSRAATLTLLADLAARQPFEPEPEIEKTLRRFFTFARLEMTYSGISPASS